MSNKFATTKDVEVRLYNKATSKIDAHRVTVHLLIDGDMLIDALAHKAARNVGGKARMANGAISLKVLK